MGGLCGKLEIDKLIEETRDQTMIEIQTQDRLYAKEAMRSSREVQSLIGGLADELREYYLDHLDSSKARRLLENRVAYLHAQERLKPKT